MTNIIEQVDPRTLLLTANIRQADVDQALVSSVAMMGILQPVVAVRTIDQGLQVRFGHRRTLAAIQAGLSSVPVIVAGDESTDDDGQIERMLQQWAENQHRAGLTDSEQVEAFAQLAAFGLSVDQIAERTRADAGQVQAALSVAKSTKAREAVGAYELTIEQAALVAEFEDDPEAFQQMIRAAQRGQLDHTAQRLRDSRAEAARYAEVAASYREQGLTIIEAPKGYNQQAAVERLSALTDDLETKREIEVADHEGCPGHVAWLAETWEAEDDDQDDETEDYDDDQDEVGRRRVLRPVYACADPAKYGHHSRWGGASRPKASEMSEVEREAAASRRREVITNNKAWDSARTVRRNWLKTFAARKSAPKGTGTFLTQTVTGVLHVEVGRFGTAEICAELFGGTAPGQGRQVSDLAAKASESRALVIALCVALAAFEGRTDRNSWRSPTDATATYLRFLASNGYTLSNVERLAARLEPLAEQDDDAA